MSRTNKHRTNHINSISLLYMKEELGPRHKCPRRSCSGTMIEVYTRYCDHGPINKEMECCVCGKVIKDPKYKKEREKYWRQKKKKWHNNNNNNNNNNKQNRNIIKGEKNATNKR